MTEHATSHNEVVHKLPVKKRMGVKASIFLLPNMITAASLFFGFLSMRYAVEARFLGLPDGYLFASYCIIFAAICDGLDGSVARLTHTQSSFGVQLDSLCDLVSFGVAPAFLLYNFTLHSLGRWGFSVSFIYAICGALRLARFNVQSSQGKASGNFTGIPIPMAAMPVAVYIMAQQDLGLWTLENGYQETLVTIAKFLTVPKHVALMALVIMAGLGLGMISTFEYISTKTIKLPRKRPFKVLSFVLLLSILVFTFELSVTLTFLMVAYCLHGPILWFWLKRDREEEEEELFADEMDEPIEENTR